MNNQTNLFTSKKQLLIFSMSLFFVLLLPLQNIAQKNKKPAPNSFNEFYYNTMEWRLVGPFRGGRAGTVAGVTDNPNLYYIGTAGGGVWKTKDGGNSWNSISDGYFGGSIGAIAVAESDPNVIYVGEGEQTVRGNVSSGKGLWQSTDAGDTWKSIGLKKSEHIGRIRIHPTNPDILYVAAMGNLWIPNEERGLYRSKDGGTTWKKILYVSETCSNRILRYVLSE